MEPITRRTALGAAFAFPAAAALSTAAPAAGPPTEIELFFPVPVQGMLANKMRELIDRFNAQHPDIKVTAVYTGSYDDTNLKTRAAIKAGRPPGAVIMSANFVREYVINDEVDPFDPLIEKAGKTPDAFMDEFWPALKSNAMIGRRVYGIPFQNSTPLLYYNVAAFTEAGLDPDRPPATWADWIAAAKKLAKTEDGQAQRWGLMFPGTYDYCGWIVSGLTMSNGGQYFNHDYGGEVYYTAPSALGALTLLDTMVNRLKVIPPGVSDANACTSAFFGATVRTMPPGPTKLTVPAAGSTAVIVTRPWRTRVISPPGRSAVLLGLIVIPASAGVVGDMRFATCAAIA